MPPTSPLGSLGPASAQVRAREPPAAPAPARRPGARRLPPRPPARPQKPPFGGYEPLGRGQARGSIRFARPRSALPPPTETSLLGLSAGRGGLSREPSFRFEGAGEEAPGRPADAALVALPPPRVVPPLPGSRPASAAGAPAGLSPLRTRSGEPLRVPGGPRSPASPALRTLSVPASPQTPPAGGRLRVARPSGPVGRLTPGTGWNPLLSPGAGNPLLAPPGGPRRASPGDPRLPSPGTPTGPPPRGAPDRILTL